MQFINENNEIVYDEANTFFILVHIMQVLDYRQVCDKSVSGLNEMEKIVRQIL